ncbi:hypothetical protein BDZ89DRAFT_1071747 [Hymenopellis radicata]|nr:hypothetical protein BDZ89DRAFT_1071747 [Hymenopellis radicata]
MGFQTRSLRQQHNEKKAPCGFTTSDLAAYPRSYPRHARRVHPIHRLPYELLALVFILAAEDDVMVAVAVSHSCRAWRAVALQTPRLWTIIRIDQRERMWAERIRRAKSCALRIRIRLPPSASYYYSDAELVQRRMYFVLPFMARWRSLDITLSRYAPFLWNAALSECCSTRLKARVEVLETLRLVYPHNDDDSKEFFLFGGYAPRLRSVTLDGVRLLWMPTLFHNLTHLDYTHHGFTSGTKAIEDVLYMLLISCHLQELSLMFRRKHGSVLSASSSHPSLSVRTRIRLPLLTTLRFRVCTSDIPPELRHVASNLRTPALQSLSFVDAYPRRTAYPSTRMFFKHYSFPSTLESLRRDRGWCEPQSPGSCPCIEPHVRAACPTHDQHL